MAEPTTARLSEFADTVIWRALLMMQEQGVPFDLMMDRVLTATAAHIASNDGPEKTAKAFRDLADNIEAGALDSVKVRTPETVQ